MIAALAIALAVTIIVVVWQAARMTRLTRELDAANARAVGIQGELLGTQEQLTSVEIARDDASGRIDSAVARATEAEAARRNAESSLSAAYAEVGAATSRAQAAEIAAEAAQAAATTARAALVDAGWGHGPGPGTLWSLELARSERTWRNSVATDPGSVFEPGSDRLRTAIETDLAAAREEAGVDIRLVWELVDEIEALAALAVLRVAQELVAGAVPLADEAQLVVEPDDDDVIVRIAERDGSAGRFSELAVTSDDAGLLAVAGGLRVVGAVQRPQH
jgi:hypothetical protein